MDWILDGIGRDPETAVATMVEAHVHQDERAPHAHYTLVPATEAHPRPSKRAVQYALARMDVDRADLRKAHPVNLGRAILDRFQADVAGKHGLSRGRVGGNSVHQPTDHAKGLADRTRDAEEAAVYAAGVAEEALAEKKALADGKEESDRRAAAAEQQLVEERAAREVLEQAARTERNERVAAEVRQRYAEKAKSAAEAARNEAQQAKAAADDLVAAYGQANRENRVELKEAKRQLAAAEAAKAADPEAEPAKSRHPVRAKSARERALGRARGRLEQEKVRRELEGRQAEKKPRRARSAPARVPDLRGGYRSGQTGGEFVPQGGRRGRGR